MDRLSLEIRLIPALIVFLLSACGGDDSQPVGGGNQQDENPIEEIQSSGFGIAYGPISGFGSIFVDGIKFSTVNTEYLRDGIDATQPDFEVGEFVTVQGELEPDGTWVNAENISYQENLVGMVTRVWQNNFMEVLGQTIVANSLAFLKGFSFLEDLVVGDIIEVSGFVYTDATILATHIIKHDDLSSFSNVSRLTGTIVDLDATAQTFSIGGLTVDYSSASLVDFPGGEIANGIITLVLSAQNVSGNVLSADTVQAIGCVIKGNEGDKIEMAGTVGDISGSGGFDVGCQPVTMQDSTSVVNGSAEDIVDGEQVEVEGLLNGSGVLVADNVVLFPDSNITVIANVDAVDAGNNVVTVLGTTAKVNNFTLNTDESSAGIRRFGLEDVAVGDWVEVRGFQRVSGTFVATKMERRNTDPQAQIRGPVENPEPSSGTVDVLDTTVLVQEGTDIKDKAGNPISIDEFFSSLDPGETEIEAKGSIAGQALLAATEIQIKIR